MRAVKLHGTARKIQRLVNLSKQALRDGAYRVAGWLHAVALNMEGKTAPQIADILKVHRSKVSIWLRNWQQHGMDGVWRGIGPVVPQPCPRIGNGNLPTSWTAGLWRMDSPGAYGQARWSPESLKRNFPLPTIRPMFPVSFTILDFRSSAPERRWPRQTRISSPAGFAINTPALKKSPERRSGRPLRRRSKLPARPHALSHLGADRVSAGNTDYGAEKHPQDFRYDRAALCAGFSTIFTMSSMPKPI